MEELISQKDLLGGGYHRLCAYGRETMSGRGLNFANQPKVDKSYPDRPVVDLPERLNLPLMSLFQAIPGFGRAKGAGQLDLKTLAAFLKLANSLTAQARSAGGVFNYRSAPSAGALYPNEIYVVARGVAGLADGVHHYSAIKARLSLLRDDLPEGPPGLGLIISAIFFRSSWKYAGRAYRYCLLDGGHILGNIHLAAGALGLGLEEFSDQGGGAWPDLETGLGLDPEREVWLTALTTEPELMADLAGLAAPQGAAGLARASRVAELENGPELPRRAHLAGTGPGGGGKGETTGLEVAVKEWRELGPGAESPGLVESLAVRRSKRNYLAQPVAESLWQALLTGLCQAEPQPGEPEVVVVSHQLAGLADGVHLLDRTGKRLGLAKPGNFMESLARASLDQMWLANCSLIVVLAMDVDAGAGRMGQGAYRRAMLAAGKLSQWLQLTAAGLGLGSCGIGAFYDEEVADILGLGPDKEVLYLNGLGKVKRM